MFFNPLGTDWFWFHTHVPMWNFSHYPPWAFVFLYPLAKCPLVVGWVVVLLLSVLVVTIYYKNTWRTVLLLTSPPAVIALLFGNIDLLMLLTFMLPLQFGLIVASCKPIMYCGWMLRKWWSRPLFIIPLVLVALISSIVWPGWWSLSGNNLAWKLTLSQYIWPWGIPIGIILLLTNSEIAWLAAGLFLSPYVSLYHTVPLLAKLYESMKWYEIILLNILLWIAMYLIRN